VKVGSTAVAAVGRRRIVVVVVVRWARRRAVRLVVVVRRRLWDMVVAAVAEDIGVAVVVRIVMGGCMLRSDGSRRTTSCLELCGGRFFGGGRLVGVRNRNSSLL
jgi:hypothetical protein